MAIENNIKTLPKNIRAKLYGFVTKDEMKQIYLSKPINLFLHVSNTEGLGMAIIEAQSYGIPGLCCAAGGVVDVVNAQTGILMPVEVSAQEIANHISEFRTSPMNTTVFRNMVRNHFRSKFSIDSNFKELMKIFESN
jgi:glycosyltransferase involved in cell wall biosynthesis